MQHVKPEAITSYYNTRMLEGELCHFTDGDVANTVCTQRANEAVIAAFPGRSHIGNALCITVYALISLCLTYMHVPLRVSLKCALGSGVSIRDVRIQGDLLH